MTSQPEEMGGARWEMGDSVADGWMVGEATWTCRLAFACLAA